jgi:hypothetical protein
MIKAATILPALFLSGCSADESMRAHPSETTLDYFGLHIHHANKSSDMPEFTFGSWRLWDAYVGWPYLEPALGVWDFTRLDRLVQLATDRHVSLILPLGPTPTWASARPAEKSFYKPGNAAEPYDLELWRNYIRTLAVRYNKKIQYYEVWNEPDIAGFYSGDMATLVKMIEIAHEEIKSINPKNVLISTAPSSPSPNGLRYFEKLIKAGGLQHADVIGYHMYIPKEYPERLVQTTADIRKILEKHNLSHKPLWNTESGWWIGRADNQENSHQAIGNGTWLRLDPDTQAGAFVARSLILGRAVGLDRFYWYAWDNKYGLGMIDPSTSQPGKIATAYATTIEWLNHSVINDCTQNKNNLMICQKTDRMGKQSHIIWSTSAQSVEFTIPSHWSRKFFSDVYGQQNSVPSTLKIIIQEVPILLS